MVGHQHPKMKTDEEGNLWLNFGEYGQEIEVACFAGDGSRVLTVQEVGVAKIWDTTSRELVGELHPVSELSGSDKAPTTLDFQVFIEAAALDSQGKLALLGLNDGTAGVFDVATGERLSTMYQKDAPPGYWDLIRAVNFSADCSLTLVGFYDRTVGVWDGNGQNLVAKLCPYNADSAYSKDAWGRREGLASSVAASSDNRYVFVGSVDFTCNIWDLESKELVFTATEYREQIISVLSLETVFMWATAGGAIWQMVGDKEPEKIVATGTHWTEVGFAPSGKFVLVRTGSGIIEKRNLVNGEVEALAELEPDGMFENRTKIGFLDGDNYFYATSDDTLRLDDKSITSIGEEDCQDQIRKVLVSPDNSILAIKSQWSGIGLWDRETGQFIRRLRGDIYHYRFSRDSSKIAYSITEHEHGLIVIEEVRTGEVLHQLIGHERHDVVFEFGVNDDTIISGSCWDQTVRLWQTDSSGQYSEVQKLKHQKRESLFFSVLSDGKIVICRDESGIEVRSPDLTEEIAQTKMYIAMDPVWCIDESRGKFVLASYEHEFATADLTTGKLGVFMPDLDRPEWVPDNDIRVEIEAREGAYMWRQFGGPYMHITDGPRGWATPIPVSQDKELVVIACHVEYAILSIKDEVKVLARFPFEGRLRASYVDHEKAIVVNSAGRLFFNEYSTSKVERYIR